MMVRPGDNKFNDKSHWGILYLGENKYNGMIRFSQVLRSAHFPKIFGVFVRNTLNRIRHSSFSLDQFRKSTFLCKRFQVKFINVTSNN